MQCWTPGWAAQALGTVMVVGCVRTITLPSLENDPDTPTDTGGSDTETSDTGQPDTPTDTGGSDTGEGESVCVPGRAEGFVIPHGRWALAVLHASRRYGDLSDSALSLSPEWFLASAWQSTAFSCAEYGLPWSHDPQDEAEGCLSISETTMWPELVRFFPEHYTEDGYVDAFSGDQVAASVMALTWFTMAAHVLILKRHVNPDDWYAAASDPLAVEKVSALLHHMGPWTNELYSVLSDCSDQVEDCLSKEASWYVTGMVDKMAHLQDAECYEDPLTESDVRQYVAGLSTAWPREDWDAVEAAALAAWTGAAFSEDAPRILDAIDAQLVTRLACPEEVLWEQFRLSCP